jgi:peptidoglycan/xylan/chitin deacetylase (PgdA/CDA1 family)
MRVCIAAALALFTACHDDLARYDWDGADVICSALVDNLGDGKDGSFDRIEERLEAAADLDAVAVFHAHQPNLSISVDRIAQILERADAHGLDYITFSEMVPGARARPGIGLAFDDNDVAGWFSVRALLLAHAARVTFFVTRWSELTAEDLDMLAALAADGHDVQPHGVGHLHGPAFVAEHGLDAYLADEVVPSIQIMLDAGYAPTTFAFPFGETSPDITAGVLEHIDRVRVTLTDCPR